MLLTIFYAQSPYDIGVCLNDEEVRRSRLFRQEQDRHTFVFAHSLKRRVLSEFYPDRQPAHWAFSHSESGKPYVQEPISFNLSHSHGAVAVVALAGESHFNLGVDIECYRALDDMDSLIDVVLHPAEIEILKTFDNRCEGFYRLWTIKESVLKANGSGLVDNLSDMDCSSCFTTACFNLVWKGERYWLHTRCFEWGVCSVAWREDIPVEAVSFVQSLSYPFSHASS